MKFGIDRLIAEPKLRAPLSGKRVALLAHPASVTADLTHSLDALAACPEGRIEVLANYTAFRDLKKALSKEATNA